MSGTGRVGLEVGAASEVMAAAEEVEASGVPDGDEAATTAPVCPALPLLPAVDPEVSQTVLPLALPFPLSLLLNRDARRSREPPAHNFAVCLPKILQIAQDDPDISGRHSSELPQSWPSKRTQDVQALRIIEEAAQSKPSREARQ